MNREKRHLMKILSILFQYPERDLINHLDELRVAVKEISQPEAQERCSDFLSYLRERELIHLQEVYTATFDLNPTTCLNLTYHRWGDARERGNALVDFHQLYHTAGYECATGELPDYLPLILEFLSINRQEKQFSFLGQYSDQVQTIGSHLQEAGSPYIGIFEMVEDIFRELKTNGT